MSKKVTKKEVEAEFHDTWSTLLSDMVSERQFSDISGCMNRLEQLMTRNVPHGKHARAYLHIFLYRALRPKRTEEDDFLNYIQTASLIADDIMDNSETRRGMPCWHQRPEVGLSAINDVFLLEQVAQFIRYKYFTGKDYLLRLQELIHDDDVRTVLGQSLDLKMASYETLNFSWFTEATYKAQVKYKTSYYTFHGPAARALIRAGITDPECYKALEELTLLIGELFQIQDDFLDCYGDPEVTGKVGTDIRDGKMTWLIVKALETATKSQTLTLQENYGKGGTTAEYQVRAIYDELGIEEMFYKHEDAMRKEILAKIKALPSALPQKPFLNLLDAIYRREK